MNVKALSLVLGFAFVGGCFAQFLPVLDHCIICSSFTNITCATNPDSHQRLQCNPSINLTGCYTRIIPGGFTERGCASELNETALADCQNDRCLTCIGGSMPAYGCNNNVFPEHRRTCHQCQDAVNGTCDAIPMELPTVCEIFDVNDRCYIHRTNTTVTRGCTSDFRRLCVNPQHCHICEISGCNNLIGNSDQVPIAPPPSSAVTNKISIIMLSTAFIFALAKF